METSRGYRVLQSENTSRAQYDHMRWDKSRRFLRFAALSGFYSLISFDRVEGLENVPAEGQPSC
jgi:hypothetical protein